MQSRLLQVLLLAVCCAFMEGSGRRTPNFKFPSSLREIDLKRGPPPTFYENILAKLSNHAPCSPSPAPVKPASIRNRVVRCFEQTGIMSLLGGAISTKKKMLVLMSDTGGGHRASAQALDQAIQDQYPGRVDVTVMDIWTDHGSGLFRKLVPMYRHLAKRPLLWRAFYSYGLFPPTRMLTELDSKIQCYQKFKNAIEAADPDMVVSVHPLCQLMPISIVKELNRIRPKNRPRIPFITVVTDLGSAHCTWFDRRTDAVYVPSEAVRDVALRNGIPAEKILMKGLPIRPAFWKAPRSKLGLRRALGVPLDSRAVLLMGGGDGVGGLSGIATEVAKTLKSLNFKTHMTVICGHNAKTKEDLTRALVPSVPEAERLCSGSVWLQPVRLVSSLLRNRPCAVSPPHEETRSGGVSAGWGQLSVRVRGFVDNIDEHMAASDLLVTKAGPGTIAEAMTRGLPIVLSSFLPGQVSIPSKLSPTSDFPLESFSNQTMHSYCAPEQEAGNVPYVTEGRFGVYTNSPKKIAAEVGALLSNASLLQDMGRRAKQLSRPQATREIAGDLARALIDM